MTTPGKSLQGEQGRSLLLNGDPSQESSAKKRAGGFGHREGRCDPLSLGTNGRLRRRIALKHGRDQGA
jgi:hypothetical protein